MRVQLPLITSLASAVLFALSGAAYANGGYNGHPILTPSANATVNTEQLSGGCKDKCGGNESTNVRNDNTSGINGSFGNVSGNVGVNVTAGDSNVQSNNAALAALDAEFITSGDTASRTMPPKTGHPAPLTFASVNAVINSDQAAKGNTTTNKGNQNSASIKDSFGNAAGNIGVNVASGTGNVQANNLAAAVADITSTQLNVNATANNSQTSAGNMVTSKGLVETKVIDEYAVALDLKAKGSYEGTGKETRGHSGHDGDDNYSRSGNYGHSDKKFTFEEEGDIKLKGSVTGMIPVVNTYASRDNFNKATISDGSFANATGNIGVNMASGSNNLQANNLTLSAGSSGN
ncbi:hypothetical protein NMD14_09700 [Aeromonas veronii]